MTKPKPILTIILQNNNSRMNMQQKVADIKHSMSESMSNDYHVIVLIGSSEQPTTCQVHNCDGDTISIELLEEKLLQSINPFDIEFKKKYVDNQQQQPMYTNCHVDVDFLKKVITLEHNNCNIFDTINQHWQLYEPLNQPDFPFEFDLSTTPILKDSWMIKFSKMIK